MIKNEAEGFLSSRPDTLNALGRNYENYFSQCPLLGAVSIVRIAQRNWTAIERRNDRSGNRYVRANQPYHQE